MLPLAVDVQFTCQCEGRQARQVVVSHTAQQVCAQKHSSPHLSSSHWKDTVNKNSLSHSGSDVFVQQRASKSTNVNIKSSGPSQRAWEFVHSAQAVMRRVALMPTQPRRLGPVPQVTEGCDWQSLSSNPSPLRRQPCDWLRA